MSQSHWNNNDENQNDCTDFAASVNRAHDINRVSDKNPWRVSSLKKRICPALAATLLCSALCGCGGDVPANPKTDDESASNSLYSMAPGFDTSTDLREVKTGGVSEGASLPYVSDCDFGLTLYDATSAMTAWYNFKLTREGAYVVDSKYANGFQYGDYLYSINGQTVSSAADAQRAFAACAIGERVTVQVIRALVHGQGENQVVREQMVTLEMILREYLPQGDDVRFEVQP